MEALLEDLARGIETGHRPALARALSLAERDAEAAAALLARLADRLGRAHVIGITGPPGAGKSSLVGVMARQLLQQRHGVAVLAVDPSSPVSGGALLGDRFRIGEAPADARAFIRSTATRGSLGGLTHAARQMVQLMDAAGFDLILVETVGTGQSEIDVAGMADTLLVAFPPGLGDELQALKAGVLELADFLVVTKSDTAAASQAILSLQSMAPLWRKAAPIHAVSARNGDGVADLVQAILERAGAGLSSATDSPPGMPVTHAVLLEAFTEVWQHFERRLPGLAAGRFATRVLAAESGGDDSVLRVRVSREAPAEGFDLGMAAGALAALGAQAGLDCRVEEWQAQAGFMNLVVVRAA